MIADLKTHQGDEYAKHESCKKDLITNERATRGKTKEKEDTESTIIDLEAGQIISWANYYWPTQTN